MNRLFLTIAATIALVGASSQINAVDKVAIQNQYGEVIQYRYMTVTGGGYNRAPTKPIVLQKGESAVIVEDINAENYGWNDVQIARLTGMFPFYSIAERILRINRKRPETYAVLVILPSTTIGKYLPDWNIDIVYKYHLNQ